MLEARQERTGGRRHAPRSPARWPPRARGQVRIAWHLVPGSSSMDEARTNPLTGNGQLWRMRTGARERHVGGPDRAAGFGRRGTSEALEDNQRNDDVDRTG